MVNVNVAAVTLDRPTLTLLVTDVMTGGNGSTCAAITPDAELCRSAPVPVS